VETALLDGALNEEREVVQLLVGARATGSEGVRVEVFQLLDVDARVALLALLAEEREHLPLGALAQPHRQACSP
jgi:hypothetical protein